MSVSALAVDPAAWEETDRAAREETWPHVEALLDLVAHKSKPVQRSLRKYYLTGDLPDWDKAHKGRIATDPDKRHLDIFSFLWLHPDQEHDALTALKARYLASAEPGNYDLSAGLELALTAAIAFPAENCTVAMETDGPGSEVEFRVLPVLPDPRPAFRVLFIGNAGFELRAASESKPYPFGPGFPEPRRWLSWPSLTPESAAACTLSDPDILELMRLHTCADPKSTCSLMKRYPGEYEKVLLRIRRFVEEREAEGPRADYARLMCGMLDNREWPDPVPALWEKVSAPAFGLDGLWDL